MLQVGLNIDALVDALSATLVIGFASCAVHAAVLARVSLGAHGPDNASLAAMISNLRLNRAVELRCRHIATILPSAGVPSMRQGSPDNVVEVECLHGHGNLSRVDDMQ